MRKTLALFAVVLTLGMTAMSFDAEAARRMGGGKSTGMQRQTTTAPPANTPAGATNSPSQAAPAAGTAAAAGAPAAAAAKRSWMGPIAGLAAGLGIAALMSHLGLGEAFGNMLMIALLVMAALMVVGFFMRKRAAAQGGAMAGAGHVGSVGGPFGQQQQPNAYRANEPAMQPRGGSLIGSRIGGGVGASGAAPAAAAGVGFIPADFDAVGFAKNAEDQFMALQAANDAGDLVRLRGYLTPEMFEAVKADIDARGDAPQQTQVFGLNAQVLDVVEEGNQYIVSVRFQGSVRDEPGAVPEDLNEIWHLTKPKQGMGGWMIAGIQQAQ
ncbi:TIM44-like domain-containing protein [Ramlibacter sp. PS3R-8]|uniref:Tim44 domain-containing protein n=1 Tax=Ramlibacter sp. PS3R-8 TaxID=3133437 RepID=UPI0030A537E7